MKKFFSSLIHFFVRATILSQEFIPLEERVRLLRLHEEQWRKEERKEPSSRTQDAPRTQDIPRTQDTPHEPYYMCCQKHYPYGELVKE